MAFTKPDQLPRWATSETYISEPNSSNKDDGFRPNTQPPAQWFNWIFNKIYNIFGWFFQQHVPYHYTYDIEGSDLIATVTSSYPTYATLVDGFETIRIDAINCDIGDILLIDFAAIYSLTGEGALSVRAKATQDFGGAAVAAQVPGARILVNTVGNYPFAINGALTITNAGTCRIEMQGAKTGGTATVRGVPSLRVLRIPKF